MLTPFAPAMTAIHVVTAVLSIVLGILAMRSNTSPKRHGQIGRAYGVTMGISMITAVLLLTVRFNFFLTMITILSSQSLITGWRAAKMKARGKPALFDWAFTFTTGAFGGGYVLWTIATLAGVLPPLLSPTFTYIGLGFALFICKSTHEEITFYRSKSSDRRAWLYFHFDRMLGSFAALSTAFSISVGGYLLPPQISWITWVATPVVAGLMIARYNKSYRSRYAQPAAVAAD